MEKVLNSTNTLLVQNTWSDRQGHVKQKQKAKKQYVGLCAVRMIQLSQARPGQSTKRSK